eukprot:5852241-Pleurochrysis_carterae.AAC.5
MQTQTQTQTQTQQHTKNKQLRKQQSWYKWVVSWRTVVAVIRQTISVSAMIRRLRKKEESEVAA